jgi:hypothetical protein
MVSRGKTTSRTAADAEPTPSRRRACDRRMTVDLMLLDVERVVGLGEVVDDRVRGAVGIQLGNTEGGKLDLTVRRSLPDS